MVEIPVPGTGTILRVWVIYPDEYDPAKPTPTLLTFPPGGQDLVMVDYSFNWWGREAIKRGWLLLGSVFAAGLVNAGPVAANILKAEEKKDGKSFDGAVDAGLLATRLPRSLEGGLEAEGHAEDLRHVDEALDRAHLGLARDDDLVAAGEREVAGVLDGDTARHLVKQVPVVPAPFLAFSSVANFTMHLLIK